MFSLGKNLEEVRKRSPLIHNVTNYVVMNFSANVLLAAGASPVMAHAEDEVEEMAGLADALVINIGTLSEAWVKSMELAMMAARKKGIPIVLDPVGAGATRFRTEVCHRFIEEFTPFIIKGNASEILSLGSSPGGKTKGVDSTHGAEEALAVAKELARRKGCIVCISGIVDYITDGRQTARVRNGHHWMTNVTGMGCSATALVGAVSAVEPDAFIATASAMAIMGICGEAASRESSGPGSFQKKFIDTLFWVTPVELEESAKIEMVHE